jgi:hypothetical protein
MNPPIKICCISIEKHLQQLDISLVARMQWIRTYIDEVQPFAIDVCSGARTNGKPDKNKL